MVQFHVTVKLSNQQAVAEKGGLLAISPGLPLPVLH